MYTSEETGLDKTLISWIYRYAARQYWRVASWYDYEDLVQDAMFIVVKCRTKYPELDKQHFSARFRTAFTHHITDLANQRITGKCLDPKRHGIKLTAPLVSSVDDTTLSILLNTLREESTQFIAVLFSEAPSAIKSVIALFNDPQKLILMQAPLKRGETRNRRLCKLIELDPEEDVCGMIRTYFGTA